MRGLTHTKAPLIQKPLPSDDPTQRKPDITKARELLGWEPSVHVRDGIAHTAAHFRERLTEG